MSISIPADKLTEIRQIIEKLLLKKTVTRKKLESIIGKLSYIADCIRSARLFISRLLNLLRTVYRKSHHINLNTEAKKDLKWFFKFMTEFNGRTTIPDHLWSEPDQLMQTDASLLGLGGVFHDSGCTKLFHCAIPASWSGHHICVYELLAIFIGLRVWGPILQDKRLLLQCDNSSSVILINTGRCRDKVMLSIARNIWLLCSYFNIQIKAIHIQGIDNRVADLLSRWTEIRSPYEKITSLLDDCCIEEVQIASCMFDVDNSI
jgi:hypothetical protein